MPIDIDSLTEQELRDLHRRVTERLRFFAQARAHRAMLEFSIGDRVEFDADGRTVTGVITRYNRKTVSLLADDAGRWNVSPALLRPAPAAPHPAQTTRVVVRPVPHQGGPAPASGVLARLGRVPGGA